MKILHYLVVVALLTGCSSNKYHSISSDHDLCAVSTMPPTAMEKILDDIGGVEMTYLQTLVFSREDEYDYLGFVGSFDVLINDQRDMSHLSFVLRKDRESATWKDAKVYIWETGTVEITDLDTGIVTDWSVGSLVSLFSLPNEQFLGFLKEIQFIGGGLHKKVE